MRSALAFQLVPYMPWARHAAPLWHPPALRWAPRTSPLSYVWLDDLGGGSHEIFDISLVVREAFANAIEPPRDPQPR